MQYRLSLRSASRAWLTVAGLAGVLGLAQIQDALLPEPSDTIGGGVQSIISLLGSDAAVTGRFDDRGADDGSRTKVDAWRLAVPFELPTPTRGWWQGTRQELVLGLASYRESTLAPVSDGLIGLRASSELLSAGWRSLRPLGDGLYLKTQAMVHGGRTRIKANFDATYRPDLYHALFDGRYVNTQVRTLSLSGEAGLGWRVPLGRWVPPPAGTQRPSAGHALLLQWVAAPALTRTVAVDTLSQRFTRSSLSWHGKVAWEWVSDRRVGGRPLALTTAYQHHRFPGSAEGVFGRYVNEVSVGLVAADRQRELDVEGYGLTLAHLQGPDARGWRMQLEFVF